MTENSNLNEAIEEVIKLCLSEILKNQPPETIMKKSKAIELASELAKKESKNLKNMEIHRQSIEINPNYKKNFSKRIGIAQGKIGEIVINKIIDEIPAKYTELLANDFMKMSKSIHELLEDPDHLLSEFTKEKLDQLLQNLENPFVKVTIEKWEIITKREKQHIKCDLKFEIKENSMQPVAKINLNPPLVRNPLLKIKFQIDGTIKFSGMKISNIQKFKISLGNLDAVLTTAIKEITVMDTLGIKQKEDVLYTITKKEIKRTLPEIVIKDNS